VQPSARGRGKRLLYWFRTPPGVRVGRAPIDETAIRLLEQHNPDVEFDWTRILKAPPAAEAPPRRDRDARDRDQRGRREARPPQRSRSGGAPPPDQRSPRVDAAPAAPTISNSEAEAAPALDAEVATDPALVAWEAWAASEPRAADYLGADDELALDADLPAAASAEAGADVSIVPAFGDETAPALGADVPAEALAEAGADAALGADLPAVALAEAGATHVAKAAPPDDPDDEPDEVFEARPEDVGSASYQRLGAEGLVRLRARYAEVMARIAERPLEDQARDELQQRAERLNPDAWVTADEVSAALEQYETVFEGLRGVVGRHPRRRRRGRR
jgi:hypothetical protein